MRLLIGIAALIFTTSTGMAQSTPTERGALKDAEHALRKFDEVTARIDFTRWEAKGPVVGHIQESLNVIKTTYVNEAEATFAELDAGRQPTATDFLVIMVDVENAGIELLNLSDSASDLQDPGTVDTNKLSQRESLVNDLNGTFSDAHKAATELFVVLRKQIGTEEELLKMCLHASTPAKSDSKSSKR